MDFKILKFLYYLLIPFYFFLFRN